MEKRKADCPCSNTSCARHGDCAACKDYHYATGSQTCCKNKKETDKNG